MAKKMTRQQRRELCELMDRIATNSGLALDIVWKSAKSNNKEEAEALDQVGELMISAAADINDLQNLLSEISAGVRS